MSADQLSSIWPQFYDMELSISEHLEKVISLELLYLVYSFQVDQCAAF